MAMATRVKQEPVSPTSSSSRELCSPPPALNSSITTSDYEQRILLLLQGSTKPISDKEIQNEIPNLSPQERAEAINSLLKQGSLEIFKQGDKLVYKYKEPSSSSNIKGADNEEKIVYSIIEKAGNKGIWIRDLRYESNLIVVTLQKILKNLENKKIIKAVKSVSASKKKVYMLYSLEPDSSVTGGAWYNDQDFESEFVDVLNQQCFRFLHQKKEAVKNCKDGPIAAQNMASASSKDVWKYISELGISKVQLSVQDMETILNTLVYDGKAERTVLADGNHMYRAIESLLPPPGIVRTPCGVCPVFNQCSDIGSINPKKCVYMTEWLE
ncbi:hypothetical protein FOCC_FOCC015896 [Frankliniella occidentalis]|uniref:DNA-directed RNA polymerase III subunit RPC6 n=1 Tax=Frankliniella occidentalis TaxID=133901 RepID=A0A6J1TC54_FRAOC|nr:probable DNA-directed RNA polymerase III subunit RPC6 [Frankliniella occidentalis]XP_026290356.1 probable DNA-directed RNA polymerase III subunit RPC6 [Frankliniella occidentalis]XP_026290357.1 probable DNA-directed RNA polymerase III subunit RPC6 [Frankliniella occidentalis]XP_052130748.1 probable DNA-directed RNA polymerase III subunit RPC6 [Frankliniella occidentalis]XP_052130749.1 probable DNA-directed RNA polymerase III subunit RPC6 [Frankliniella occidentalis]KAE8738620.1 hypothetical